MKKFLMFLCCVFVMNAAWAGCKVLTCDRNGDFINGWARTHVGGTQCWWCGPGPNSCNNHDIVSVKDEVGDVVWLYQCNMGLVSNKFSNFTPEEYCADSPLKNKQAENAKVTYSVKDYAKTSKSEFGDWYINDGSASCIYVKCNEGYGPSADRQSCVLEAESNCVKGGGKWLNENCDCSHKNQGATKYEWNGKTCVLTKDSQNAINNAANAAAQVRANQANCVDTGGSWVNNKCSCNSQKFLQDLVAGKTCKCIDGYRWNSDFKSCVITDVEKLKQICNKHGDIAHWSDFSSKCVCDNDELNVKMFDYDKESCVVDAEYTACVTKKSEATWNNGACNCNKTGYMWDKSKGDCVEGDELIQQRENDRVAQNAARIDGMVANLDNMFGGLEVSKWKNADGKFNIARLASDSIAGVVLGTAGGLITSHVVKKNQVKKGFEDVQCTVGGQKVADWGDEFTVGIQ